MSKKWLLLLLVTSLISCSNGQSSIDVFQKGKETKSDLIFSEIQIGSFLQDRAIEIYNKSESQINLKEYSINIYEKSNVEPYITINLSGTLDKNDTYVIVYSESNSELKSKADLISDDLIIDGTWPISLDKGNAICDVLGRIGYQNNYGRQLDLVRKKEFLTGRTVFFAYDWIRYSKDDYSHLGTIETTLTEEELLKGPKLTQEDFDKPFVNEDGSCGGGAVKATLRYKGDGDTTQFYLSNVTSSYVQSYERIRYLGINTPETQHTNIQAQPWGYAAQDYNNEIINNAKAFAIQTSTSSQLREAYGRMLAYVWYSNVDNPKPEDYTMLNFVMIREGYAWLYFANESLTNDSMFYKKLTYTNFMRNAEIRAENLGIKIHGEKDPTFNY